MKIRYSKYQKPLLLLIDLTLINSISFWFLNPQKLQYYFYGFISIIWIIASVYNKFYNVQRYTGVLKLLRLVVMQLGTFILGYFAYFGIFKEGMIVNSQFNTILSIVLVIFLAKITVFYTLKKYRKLGKNNRNVIFIEKDETSKRVIKLFQSQKNLGYQYKGFFSKTITKDDYLGSFKKIENFLKEHKIHEIYATVSVLKKNDIKKLTRIATETETTLKLIPDANELYSKNQIPEFYDDTFQILKVRKMPFEYLENRFIKRIFDIVFSLLVIIFVMSWLTPILYILIKLESKGNLFFKQEREGLNGEKFICYKFRSMRNNNLADKVQATKNDERVTKVGKVIRKTSIDEFPQFFNALLGNMSVVGPRPHMESLSIECQNVDNYMSRNSVKPGITGHAQVSGFRGEIKEQSDIENRVRFDIFYIENWSFFLDIKIIIKTIVNIIKGEENAY